MVWEALQTARPGEAIAAETARWMIRTRASLPKDWTAFAVHSSRGTSPVVRCDSTGCHPALHAGRTDCEAVEVRTSRTEEGAGSVAGCGQQTCVGAGDEPWVRRGVHCLAADLDKENNHSDN